MRMKDLPVSSGLVVSNDGSGGIDYTRQESLDSSNPSIYGVFHGILKMSSEVVGFLAR